MKTIMVTYKDGSQPEKFTDIDALNFDPGLNSWVINSASGNVIVAREIIKWMHVNEVVEAPNGEEDE
jgi:hypothetical protein